MMNTLLKKHLGYCPLLQTVVLVGLLSSCSAEEGISSASNLRMELSGSLGESGISASTRGVIDGSTSTALALSFIRRDQQSDGNYPSYATIASALPASRAAVAGTTAGTITFTAAQYYQVRESNNNTALIGWYPQVSKGSSYSAGKVTFTLNGVTDVMLTKEQAGNKSAAVGAFVFEHQLAQVQVKAKAMDAAAAANWGTVTGVTLNGVKNSCTVTLPTSTTVTTVVPTPDFGSTTANLALKAIGSDTETTLAAAIPTEAGSTGNAFCYGLFPPTGTNTLSLDVTTQKGGTRSSVTATLSSGTITKGNIYTVTLEFKSTGINPTATISSWGMGSGANVSM